MSGYPSTQVTGQFRFKSGFPSSGRARSDEFDPAKSKSTRKSDQKHPNMTKSTKHDPEFDVSSKSAIKTMIGARNLELQLPIETAGQASQLDIPTWSDWTEPVFELAIEFWPRKPIEFRVIGTMFFWPYFHDSSVFEIICS